MFERANWQWVRDWTGRVFATAFLLLTFIFLAAITITNPAGGMLGGLLQIMLYALAAALPVGLIAGFFLARYSHAKDGRHDS